MLQEKDENEEKAKEALKQQAKTELEDWYKQHSEQVNYQKNINLFKGFKNHTFSLEKLSKLQEANRAASISYEQELETTTEKVRL